MRGRRFITVVGNGGTCMGCRMGMALGWEVWGMAGRVMGGWTRMIRDMTREMTPVTTLGTLRGTTRGTEITAHTMSGRTRVGRV